MLSLIWYGCMSVLPPRRMYFPYFWHLPVRLSVRRADNHVLLFNSYFRRLMSRSVRNYMVPGANYFYVWSKEIPSGNRKPKGHKL